MSRMCGPQQANVSRDVLATAGEFVNCPRSYFALKCTCQCLFERMDDLCPVTVSVFLDVRVTHRCDETFCAHLRIQESGCGPDAAGFLAYGFTSDGMLPHVSRALGFVDADKLLTLRHREIERLLGVALQGKLPGHTRKLASAFARHPGVSWDEVEGVGSVEEFGVCLDELTQSREQWSDCIESALRGGSAECVTLALTRSGLSLLDVPCAGIAAIQGGNLATVQRLFRSEGDLHVEYEILSFAARYGHLAVCRYLLDLGASPDVSRWGPVPEYFSVPLAALTARPPKPDDLAIAELLVSRGASILRWVESTVPRRDPKHVNLLEFAACHYRIDICRFLLAAGFPGCPANVVLHPQRGSFEPALLDLFEDLSVSGKDNLYGCGIIAAGGYRNHAAFECLLDREVDLDVCGGKEGHTPLTALLVHQSFNGIMDFVKPLLKRCPSLATKPTRGGVYPMFLMERYRGDHNARDWDEVHRILVKHGADPKTLCEPDMLVQYHPETTYSLRPAAETDAASVDGSHDTESWSDEASYADSDHISETSNDRTDRASHGKPSADYDIEEVDQRTRRWIEGGLDIHAMVNGMTTAEYLADCGDHVNLESVLRLGGQMRSSEATRLIRGFDPDDSQEFFKLLLSRVEELDAPDLADPDGVNNTVLQDVVLNCYPDMLEQLIERGTDIHKRNELGMDAFRWLFQYEPIVDREHVDELADMLVDAGADIDSRDLWGQTALWTVVQRGDAFDCNTLVRVGADVEIPNKQRVFPIDLAYFAQQFVDDIFELDIEDDVEFKRTPTAHIPNQTWTYMIEERSEIYKTLRTLTSRTPHIPSFPIRFATDNGLLTMAKVLENPHSGWNGRSPPRLAEIVTAARRQRLGELEAMCEAGAQLGFTYTTHTPLTACLSGWSVRRIPGCVTKTQVAAFLLKRCPELAHMPTADGVSPMTCIELSVPHKKERRELETLLARYI